jgi:hypothetical protein
MKLKAHSVAFALRSRIIRRGLDDEHPAGPRRQPAFKKKPPVRSLGHADAGELPEE